MLQDAATIIEYTTFIIACIFYIGKRNHNELDRIFPQTCFSIMVFVTMTFLMPSSKVIIVTVLMFILLSRQSCVQLTTV